MQPTPAQPLDKDDAWRERLLASLRDCGVQRATGTKWGRWIFNVAMVMLIAAFTFIVRQMLVVGWRPTTQADKAVAFVIWILWVLFAVFVLVRLRNRFLRKAWQSVARSAEEELARPRSRRPILYLRSFQLDERIGRASWFEFLFGTIPLANAEQELTKALKKQGPVIAIGRPDEKLPPLGAARFYVSHDKWQKKVAEVAEEAQYVIWATGSTEGLRWELAHLIAHLPPGRLILWLHPQLLRLSEQKREAEWTKFREALGELFPKPLPQTLGSAQFIIFEDDWTPIPVAPRLGIIPTNRIRSAIRTVIQAKGGAIAPASIAYDGRDRSDSFADVIGVQGTKLDFARIAAFFAANVLFRFPDFIRGQSGHALIWALAMTLITVAAYRFLREGWVPLLAALAFALVMIPTNEFVVTGLRSDFVTAFAFLAGLAWTTRRIAPLALALWLGCMAYAVARLAMAVLLERRGFFEHLYFTNMVGPILFSACLALAVKFTTPEKNAKPAPVAV